MVLLDTLFLLVCVCVWAHTCLSASVFPCVCVLICSFPCVVRVCVARVCRVCVSQSAARKLAQVLLSSVSGDSYWPPLGPPPPTWLNREGAAASKDAMYPRARPPQRYPIDGYGNPFPLHDPLTPGTCPIVVMVLDDIDVNPFPHYRSVPLDRNAQNRSKTAENREARTSSSISPTVHTHTNTHTQSHTPCKNFTYFLRHMINPTHIIAEDTCPRGREEEEPPPTTTM